jgi:lipopolysaccharide transport system permease protein
MTEENIVIHIKPANTLLVIDPREYWRARYMFKMLVWKKVRASFGEMHFWFVWVCARPLMYVLIFSIFKEWSEAKTGVNIPYVLYIYSGLILWYYFMETAIDVSKNIHANASLVTKIYIPRLLTPTVPVIANLVDLAISMVPLLVMMIYYEVYPGWKLVLLIPTLVIVMLTAMGVGLCIATITLRIRDFQKVLEFVLNVGMFISPVIFAPSMVPQNLQFFYHTNPMVGALTSWRAAIFDSGSFPWRLWSYSLIFALATFCVGLYMYRKHEHEMIEAI